MDGTFGVAKSKPLLFIVMGVDENFKGVPLAWLLFSPPHRNKQTSAGYDTVILETLLAAWKQRLEKFRTETEKKPAESFVPKVRALLAL